MTACRENNLEEVRRCIAAGVDVNGSRHPPIYWASHRGNVDIVRLLLDHGADPNRPHQDDISPLERSCRSDKIAVARLLLERGASVDSCNSRTRTTPLHHARANSTMTRLLLAYGAKFDRKDVTGSTPLYLARMWRDPAVNKVWDDYFLTHWLPLRIKLNAVGPLADSPHSSARRRVVAADARVSRRSPATQAGQRTVAVLEIAKPAAHHLTPSLRRASIAAAT